ncbi:hypothetical protein [Pseudoxanthomonas sp. PXM01]|uniref:hypothetical protein n=1 Tax=Pseudoxanthomonas sp. PXM01 TaxID=2769295 RepID=UPI00177C5BE2|nr:hypothetical protein [Pseudoxanthomonas sp. PXM01]MBD9470198.1 hypothetical protein [Pseudoxanthomonas sp. PXM01]
MKHLILCLLLAAAWLPLRAEACSCARPGTPVEEKDQHTRVFLGRVQAIEEDLRGEPRRRVRFIVSETFKGTPVRRLTVDTGIGGGDCGYAFRTGQEYVVYAWGKDDALATGICSLTGPATHPRSGLDVLRGDK